MRKAWLIFALMIGLMPGVGRAMALPAQDAAAPANSQAASQEPASTADSQPASGDAAKPAEQQAAEPKTEKAREKGDAEKDDTEPLRHSASVRYLAKLFGGDVEKAYWASVLLNFAAIAGLVIWLGRKHLPGFFSNRNAGIQKAMQEAQKASEEARRRLAEIESRLMRLDGEIGQMRDAAEREAASEEARIVAATEEEAKKIAAAAGLEIDAAAKAARRELAALAADLAVGLAAKQIHVDQATDQNLVSSFSQQLDGVSNAPKGGR